MRNPQSQRFMGSCVKWKYFPHLRPSWTGTQASVLNPAWLKSSFMFTQHLFFCKRTSVCPDPWSSYSSFGMFSDFSFHPSSAGYLKSVEKIMMWTEIGALCLVKQVLLKSGYCCLKGIISLHISSQLCFMWKSGFFSSSFIYPMLLQFISLFPSVQKWNILFTFSTAVSSHMFSVPEENGKDVTLHHPASARTLSLCLYSFPQK